MEWLLTLHNFIYIVFSLGIVLFLLAGCVRAARHSISIKRLVGVGIFGTFFALVVYHWRIGYPLLFTDGELDGILVVISIFAVGMSSILLIEMLHPGSIDLIEAHPNRKSDESN